MYIFQVNQIHIILVFVFYVKGIIINSMLTVIVYQSLLGASKKYAYWLANNLDCPIYTFKNIPEKKLRQCDIVIVISGTYFGIMPLVQYIKRNWGILQSKKVIALAVGIISPTRPQSIQAYEKIPIFIRKKIKYFKLPGKILGISPLGEVSKIQLKPVLRQIKTGWS